MPDDVDRVYRDVARFIRDRADTLPADHPDRRALERTAAQLLREPEAGVPLATVIPFRRRGAAHTDGARS